MKDKTSIDSLAQATRSRANFSGHGNALGAAGEYETGYHPENSAEIQEPGQSLAISPGPGGFETITIAAEWDSALVQDNSFIGKLLKRTKRKNIDLDIGCLYELQNGERGAIQAFGKKFGAFHEAPYIALSDDERSGEKNGPDEYIKVNGKHWDQIKRLLVYIYIYEGAAKWTKINPKITIDVPGDDDLVLSLGAHDDNLKVCAVGGLENIRGGIKLTNYSEYFHGHPAMDRAFGFGLDWGDGKK